MKSIRNLSCLCLLLVTPLFVGCSTGEENPVSADKMSEIRKKEAEERAAFNQNANTAPTKR